MKYLEKLIYCRQGQADNKFYTPPSKPPTHTHTHTLFITSLYTFASNYQLELHKQYGRHIKFAHSCSSSCLTELDLTHIMLSKAITVLPIYLHTQCSSFQSSPYDVLYQHTSTGSTPLNILLQMHYSHQNSPYLLTTSPKMTNTSNISICCCSA